MVFTFFHVPSFLTLPALQARALWVIREGLAKEQPADAQKANGIANIYMKMVNLQAIHYL